ncbi:hypothetical protein [Xylanimonas oleitrophica]|nr:hypothetical protein [Xylanimonas oleitrophica]
MSGREHADDPGRPASPGAQTPRTPPAGLPSADEETWTPLADEAAGVPSTGRPAGAPPSDVSSPADPGGPGGDLPAAVPPRGTGAGAGVASPGSGASGSGASGTGTGAPGASAPGAGAADAGPDTAPRTGERPAEDEQGIDWRFVGRRVLVWLILAAAALVVVLILMQIIPRWWGQVVGDMVDGTTPLGVWWGLFFGAVFTGVPLAVAWQAARPGRTWSLRVAFLVIALVLALPNLFTLSVVLGTNEAAVAGQQLLNENAPAFRAATAWGVAIGAIVAVAVLVLWAGYRRRGRELKELRESEHPHGR